MAGKIIWHITMSLDGFIATSDDSVDWVFEFASVASDEALQVMAVADEVPRKGVQKAWQDHGV